MKIRGGFVSNSSSSSFVIGLPADQEINFDVVAKALFPDNKTLGGGFVDGYGGRGVDAASAVSTVLRDLSKNAPATNEELAVTIHTLTYASHPSFLDAIANEEPDYDTIVYGSKNYRFQADLTPEERNARWEKYDKLKDEWSKKVAAAMEKHAEETGVKWYILEYSDDTVYGSAMEHGGVFDTMISNGNAIRISNH